jgi:hypothetical protein
MYCKNLTIRLKGEYFLMKKIVCFSLALIMIISLFSVSIVNVGAETEGNISYFVDNGEAIVDGYTGTSESLVIPSTLGDYDVKGIMNMAFSDNTNLKSITIPEGLVYIGQYAFSDCTSLSNISFPDSLEYISTNAFNNTAWLNSQPIGVVYINKIAYIYKGPMPYNTEIILKNDTVRINNDAFLDRTRLASITIPNSVKSIGDFAFYNCSGLTSVSIPEGVTSIGINAFSDCTRLKNITIPESVTRIGGDAFINTAWLNNLPDGVVYINKIAYDYKGTIPINTEITLNNNTTSICDYAFMSCTALLDITIPDSVTSIGIQAFFC